MRLWIPLSLALGFGLLPGAENPQRGGILRVAQRAEPKTLNPVTAVDAPSREVLRRMHADLITIDRNTQMTSPSLAESWTRSRDGKTYVLKLRKGIRFSDGQPFDADDVVFSFSVYLDDHVLSPQRDLLLIDGQPLQVKKLDASTVEFRLPQPYAAAERIFDAVAMLPRHRLEVGWRAGKFREAWGLATAPSEICGLGPFRLKEYRPGERVTLERNPYYWKKSASGKEPLPYLDGIEFRFIPDEDTQLARFVAGDIDLLSRLNSRAVQYLTSRGASVRDIGPGLEYNFLVFNLPGTGSKGDWFNQAAFRRAVSLAIDRDAIVRLVFQGRADPIWGHVSPGNKYWYSASLPHAPRNLAAAREALQSSGFRWSSNGRLTDNSGKPVQFSILVSASSAERIQMATLIQADLNQLGMEVNVVTLEFRSLLDRVMKTRQFDTALMGLGGGDADPNPEMGVWLSSGAMHLWNPEQKTPATPWEAEIDTLMKRQMVTLDPVARKRLYDRVQQIIAEQLPMVFLASPHVVVAQKGNIGNLRPAILDHQTLWNCEELFLMGAVPAHQ